MISMVEHFDSLENKKKKKKKQVTFLLGADGNEWCWIMGEPKPSTKM